MNIQDKLSQLEQTLQSLQPIKVILVFNAYDSDIDYYKLNNLNLEIPDLPSVSPDDGCVDSKGSFTWWFHEVTHENPDSFIKLKESDIKGKLITIINTAYFL